MQSLSWLHIFFTFILGYFGADIFTGSVHWVADRYGSPNIPFFGENFIVPFREHHYNQEKITDHDFWETNGNSCILLAPVLGAVCVYMLNPFLEASVMFWGVGVILANQAHKWAHMQNPPTIVKFFQKSLLLDVENHDVHHVSPHNTHYCILNGWLNPILDRTRFFDKVELWLSKVGIKPYDDGVVGSAPGE